MKSFISRHKIIFSSLLIFVILGGIYSQTAPKMFVSKSHVALFRLKIENPDTGTEESRNRWIWIRDGLNLKSALINDQTFELIQKNNTVAKSMNKQELKNLISIQFTGADENNFIVEVKAPSPELAFELNDLVFRRIKFLAVDADQENFNQLHQILQQKQQSYQKGDPSYAFYQDKIRKMVFSNMIAQKQRNSAFSVITKPEINPTHIWPNFKLILLVSAITGLVIGLALEYLIFNEKMRR